MSPITDDVDTTRAPVAGGAMLTRLAALPGMSFRARVNDGATLEWVGKGSEDVTGLTADALLARRDWRSLAHPEDRARVERQVHAALAAGRGYGVGYRLVDARGTERLVWERGSPLADDGNGQSAVDGWLVEGFVQDATSELARARRWRARETLLEQAVAVARLASWEWDPDADVVEWSPELRSLLGDARADESTSMSTLLDVVHPEDRTAVESLLRRAATDGQPFAIDHRVLLRGNEVRHVHTRGASFGGDEASSRFVVGTSQDVTGRRRREDRDAFLARASVVLGASLDRDELLGALSRLAVPLLGEACVIDLLGPEGHVRRVGALEADASFAAQVEDFVQTSRPLEPGWTLREAVDTRMPVLHATIDERMLARFARLSPDLPARIRSAGVRSVMVVPLVARDRVLGALSFYARSRSLNAHDLELAQDLAVRAAMAMQNAELYSSLRRELAERERLESQLVQAQKMEAVALLAGGIAHDFNNLLAVISGFAEMALREVAADGSWTHLVEIRQAADRASSLTQQLLAFSRRQPVHPQPVSVNAHLRGAERMLRRVLGRSIELSSELTDEEPVVRIDPGQLDQVVLNLVVNARDALGGEGRVVMSTAVRSRGGAAYVSLRVRDSGEGMDAATRQRVFEPFFTTKSPGHGTGLGLATVFTIVSAAGGTVDVESTPGEGSTFTVELPLYDVEGAGVAIEGPLDGRHAGDEAVLVVADDPRVRRLVRRALEDRGYAVSDAGTGEQALASIADGARGVDLLISQCQLPDTDGLTLVDEVRERRPDVRVLLLARGTGDIARVRARASGAPVLLQPFDGETLGVAVRAALDHVGT